MWAAYFFLAVASPVAGLAKDPNTVSVSSHRQVALKLAEALYPRSTISAFSSQAAVDSLAVEFSRETQLKKLEQNYPGLRDTLLKRAPEVLDPLVESRLPALYSAMADQLLAAMPEPSLSDALAFTEGREGQAIQRAGTDHVIKNYLASGPFSTSGAKATEGLKQVSVKDPRGVHWGKAHIAVGPAIRSWVNEQHKFQSQALGELIDTIISEMVDEEPT